MVTDLVSGSFGLILISTSKLNLRFIGKRLYSRRNPVLLSLFKQLD